MLSEVSKKTLLIGSLIFLIIILVFLLITAILVLLSLVDSLQYNHYINVQNNNRELYGGGLRENPSSSQHLTDLREEVEFNLDERNQFFVGFFNTYSFCESEGVLVNFSCRDLSFVGNSSVVKDAFFIKQFLTKVEVGGIGTLKALINPSEYLVKDSYACDFQVVCGGSVVESRPVFITIIS